MSPRTKTNPDDLSRNVFVDRVAFRLSEAAGVLNDAAQALAEREAMSLKELSDLKWSVGRAVRSLDMVSAVADAFEADLLTPGGITALAAAERNAARVEASILATVHAALAGSGEAQP